MTNIQISDQATKRIAAVIGTTDPATVGKFVEHIAENEQLLQSALLEHPTESELAESVAVINQSLDDIANGRVKPFDEAIESIKSKLGFKIDG